MDGMQRLGPVPGADHLVITGTGFAGDDRQLIRKLVTAFGASYSGDLVFKRTTHLVCRCLKEASSGIKYQQAVVWRVPIVSAAWLADSLRVGRVLPTLRYAPDSSSNAVQVDLADITSRLCQMAVADDGHQGAQQQQQHASPVIGLPGGRQQQQQEEGHVQWQQEQQVTELAAGSGSPHGLSPGSWQSGKSEAGSPAQQQQRWHQQHQQLVEGGEEASTPKHRGSGGDSSTPQPRGSLSQLTRRDEGQHKGVGDGSDEEDVCFGSVSYSRAPPSAGSMGAPLPLPPLFAADQQRATSPEVARGPLSGDSDAAASTATSQPVNSMALPRQQAAAAAAAEADSPAAAAATATIPASAPTPQAAAASPSSPEAATHSPASLGPPSSSASPPPSAEAAAAGTPASSPSSSPQLPRPAALPLLQDNPYLRAGGCASDSEDDDDDASDSSLEALRPRAAGGRRRLAKPSAATPASAVAAAAMAPASSAASSGRVSGSAFHDDKDSDDDFTSDSLTRRQQQPQRSSASSATASGRGGSAGAGTAASLVLTATATSGHVARPPLQSSNAANLAAASAALTSADGSLLILKLLKAAPRGNTVRQRHGLTSLRACKFAEQVHVASCGVTLSTKEKKRCALLPPTAQPSSTGGTAGGEGGSESEPHAAIAEPQAFYQLPNGEWWVEYVRFYSAHDLADLARDTTRQQQQQEGEASDRGSDRDLVSFGGQSTAEAAAAAGGLGAAPVPTLAPAQGMGLPLDFHPYQELARGLTRQHAPLTYVQGELLVRKRKSGVGIIKFRGGGGSAAPDYFWRCAFDEQQSKIVTDRPITDFAQ